MNHSVAPLLEALADYHARDRYGFTPPGHRQGRGADPRTITAIGRDAFRSDLLATAGLDDRKSSHGYLSRAEQLMADAVGAEQAFFSTCGSSLSVKAAMLAVAGGHGDLLVSRDAHKSVVAGLVFGGVQPQWIRPRYDERLHLAHPPSPRPGRAGVAGASGRGRRADRQPDPVRHLRGHRGDRRHLPPAGQAADRGRGLGRPPAVPPGPADLGHGRRRGRVRSQRAQDGHRVRAGISLPPAGHPDRPRSAVRVRRHADDHQPERDGLRRARRLASADGRAGARPAGRRARPGGPGPRRDRSRRRPARAAGGVPRLRGLPRPGSAARGHRRLRAGRQRLRRRRLAARAPARRHGAVRPPPDRGHPVDRRRRPDRRPAGRGAARSHRARR